MHFSRDAGLFRYLTATAVAALTLAGCKDSKSPTEPIPTGNIAGAWTGTYNGIAPPQCDSNAVASFQQTGSAVEGTSTAPCLEGGSRILISGTIQGNTFNGYAMWGDPEFYPMKGTLSGSTLELTIFPESGVNPMGQLHLHR